MDSVTPFAKGVEIMPDGSVARTGTNYSGKFQEAHDASKASIQSRISNLESGGVKGTGNRSKTASEVNLNNIADFINGTKNFDDVLDDYAKIYSETVKSNSRWQWDEDIRINKIDGKSIANFKGAGVVKETVQLPEDMWKISDKQQFEWLDPKIGGRIEGYTWHHSETPGEMQLVPFGIHNITNHNGGRTKGMWADAPR